LLLRPTAQHLEFLALSTTLNGGDPQILIEHDIGARQEHLQIRLHTGNDRREIAGLGFAFGGFQGLQEQLQDTYFPLKFSYRAVEPITLGLGGEKQFLHTYAFIGFDQCGQARHFISQIRDLRGLLAAFLASPFGALAAEPSLDGKSVPVIAVPSLDAALVEYRRKLKEYTHARQQYGDEAAAYWRSVAEKRRLRNSKRRNNQEIVLDDYVLTQPPVYAGPAKPVDPSAPVLEVVPPPSKYVPVVADFLKSAEEQFNFVPQRPQSEIEYKRAYAKVASAAGLTKEQVVRIYGFEAGGNGTYDVQAGLEYPTLGALASTTALGYNQLLNTTSVAS